MGHLITRLALALLVCLFLAAPAAAFTYSNCSGGTGVEVLTITGYSLTCVEVLPADSTNDTALFHVRAKSAEICFDPDIADASDATAQAVIRHCPNGKLPAANPEYECDVISPTLTGAGGAVTPDTSPSVRCLEVKTGSYQVDMTTAVPATKTGRITLQGLGN